MTEPNRVKTMLYVLVPEDLAAIMTEDHWLRICLLIEDAIKVIAPTSENRHYIVAWKDID